MYACFYCKRQLYVAILNKLIIIIILNFNSPTTEMLYIRMFSIPQCYILFVIQIMSLLLLRL